MQSKHEIELLFNQYVLMSCEYAEKYIGASNEFEKDLFYSVHITFMNKASALHVILEIKEPFETFISKLNP